MRLKRKAIGVLGNSQKGRSCIYNIVSEAKMKKMMELTYEVGYEG